MVAQATEPDQSQFNGELVGLQTGPGRLPHHEKFHILSNRRRLLILIYLSINRDQNSFSIREIVDTVAAWENDKSISSVTRQERNRVYASVKQVHLPALDDHDVIGFDHVRGTITYGSRFDEIEAYLPIQSTSSSNGPPIRLYVLLLIIAIATIILLSGLLVTITGTMFLL